MRIVWHYLAVRWRAFVAGFRIGTAQREMAVILAVTFLLFLYPTFRLWRWWLGLADLIARQGGAPILQVMTEVLVGLSCTLAVPFFLTMTYQIIYPVGAMALLRSLPIPPRALFAVRFLPVTALVAAALAPAFVLPAAAWWQAGDPAAVAWLALGWLLLSGGAAATEFCLATALGRFRSARFARLLSDGLLLAALAAAAAGFFWMDSYARRDDLIGWLTGMAERLVHLRAPLSLYVAPQGGGAALRLLAGAAASLLALGLAAALDARALARGWGRPWTPRRVQARVRAWRPRLRFLPPVARGFILKDLPEIRNTALALGIMVLFVCLGFLGLDLLTGFSQFLATWPFLKRFEQVSIPYGFFLFAVPMTTTMIATVEERRALAFLRTLPLPLSRVLAAKLWVHGTLVVAWSGVISAFMAWYRFLSLGEACLAFLVAGLLGLGCTTWALVIGGWSKAPPDRELGILPVIIYSQVLMVPLLVAGYAVRLLDNPWTPGPVVLVGGAVFLAWIAPLPFAWRWVVRRWEEA